ncbi:amidase family protein [Nocardioides sp. C4-1]|uniref:amidase family protein n=1 Tax=Nocardioides sp. C4-1 TaxID=3151851 RepID=UPI0032668E34
MTKQDVTELSAALHFPVSDDEAEAYVELTASMAETIARFEDVAERAGRPSAPDRDPGRVPTKDEDPLHAVLRWVDVRESDEGLLAGVTMLVKDNIPVAGVPMTMGSSVLETTPVEDSELVARALAQGGRIVGITNMEAFAFSGGGETSGHARTLNAFDRSRCASGSSTGSAVGLWYDGIDLAWGTDTGGSCRIPASWSGVLGLKPTHGLVPVTGIPSSDWRFDHAGPLARRTEMMALGMEAVVDRVVVDHTVPSAPQAFERVSYVDAVAAAGESLAGLRIGLVVDGLLRGDQPGDPEGTAETSAAVRASVERLRSLGATVEEVSLPVLGEGGDVMFAAMLESATAATLGWPTGYHWWSESSPELALDMARSLQARGDRLPPNFKAVLMMGTHLNRTLGGSIGARAHQLATPMRLAVDAALDRYDVLMMPTTTHPPMAALDDAGLVERSNRGWGMMHNVPLFNLTGHPALSMPAAEVDGLPVGVMAVTRRYHDDRLLSLAQTIERTIGWTPAPSPAAAGWAQPSAPWETAAGAGA